jgi:hypothetical protein
MKRILISFLVIGFILWILPLGYFIKPSRQALACDGQRAVCMCRVMMPKSSDKAMESGLALKAGSSANKENSSGGGANYFVSAKPAVNIHLRSASIFEDQYFSYNNPFLAAVDYVPKV